MKKLKALDFSTPNNAAISLHILAEHVRAGDVKMFDAADWENHDPALMLGFEEAGKR